MASSFPNSSGSPAQRLALPRRTKILVGVGVALLVVLIVGSRLIDLYVKWLWFGALGYPDVYRTVLLTRLVQFVVGGVLIGGGLASLAAGDFAAEGQALAALNAATRRFQELTAEP